MSEKPSWFCETCKKPGCNEFGFSQILAAISSKISSISAETVNGNIQPSSAYIKCLRPQRRGLNFSEIPPSVITILPKSTPCSSQSNIRPTHENEKTQNYCKLQEPGSTNSLGLRVYEAEHIPQQTTSIRLNNPTHAEVAPMIVETPDFTQMEEPITEIEEESPELFTHTEEEESDEDPTNENDDKTQNYFNLQASHSNNPLIHRVFKGEIRPYQTTSIRLNNSINEEVAPMTVETPDFTQMEDPELFTYREEEEESDEDPTSENEETQNYFNHQASHSTNPLGHRVFEEGIMPHQITSIRLNNPNHEEVAPMIIENPKHLTQMEEKNPELFTHSEEEESNEDQTNENEKTQNYFNIQAPVSTNSSGHKVYKAHIIHQQTISIRLNFSNHEKVAPVIVENRKLFTQVEEKKLESFTYREEEVSDEDPINENEKSESDEDPTNEIKYIPPQTTFMRLNNSDHEEAPMLVENSEHFTQTEEQNPELFTYREEDEESDEDASNENEYTVYESEDLPPQTTFMRLNNSDHEEVVGMIVVNPGFTQMEEQNTELFTDGEEDEESDEDPTNENEYTVYESEDIPPQTAFMRLNNSDHKEVAPMLVKNPELFTQKEEQNPELFTYREEEDESDEDPTNENEYTVYESEDLPPQTTFMRLNNSTYEEVVPMIVENPDFTQMEDQNPELFTHREEDESDEDPTNENEKSESDEDPTNENEKRQNYFKIQAPNGIICLGHRVYDSAIIPHQTTTISLNSPNHEEVAPEPEEKNSEPFTHREEEESKEDKFKKSEKNTPTKLKEQAIRAKLDSNIGHIIMDIFQTDPYATMNAALESASRQTNKSVSACSVIPGNAIAKGLDKQLHKRTIFEKRSLAFVRFIYRPTSIQIDVFDDDSASVLTRQIIKTVNRVNEKMIHFQAITALKYVIDDLQIPHVITTINGIFLCPLIDCNEAFLDPMKAKNHASFHLDHRPFGCKYSGCDWTFAKENHLQRHQVTHENTKNYPCDEPGCDKSFKTIYNLNEHRKKRHVQPATKQCPVRNCHELFRNNKELRKHCKQHNKRDAPLKCPTPGCKRAFFFQNNLELHTKCHLVENLHICSYNNCNKLFQHAYRLKEHMRCHTGAKPYKCTIAKCIKAFSTASKLKRHEQSHFNNKHHYCNIEGCDKAFKRSDHLKEHMRQVHRKGGQKGSLRKLVKTSDTGLVSSPRCANTDDEDNNMSKCSQMTPGCSKTDDELLDEAIKSIGVQEMNLETDLFLDEPLDLSDFSTVNLRDLQ